MTVEELIDELKLYDPELEVYTDDEEEVIGLYRDEHPDYPDRYCLYLETN